MRIMRPKNESGAVVMVPEGDNSITVTLSCGAGGEVYIDNVSLQPVGEGLIIDGNFDNPTLIAWSPSAPDKEPVYVVNEHLQLPMGGKVHQDITVTAGCTLSLSYEMEQNYIHQCWR